MLSVFALAIDWLRQGCNSSSGCSGTFCIAQVSALAISLLVDGTQANSFVSGEQGLDNMV